MTTLVLRRCALWLAFSCAIAYGQQPPPTPESIMAQVAANQDRAEAERTRYVYTQHARVISRRGSTVMCEEITDSRITPAPTGVHTELLKLNGRLLRKGRYLPYTTLPPDKTLPPPKPPATQTTGDSININLDENTDRDLVENIRANLINDKSRDGLNARLFPLTTKNQAEYIFHLAARERMNGRDVFHIVFAPKDKSDFDWKGDAYIDVTAYQPVLIRTDLARKVPLAVRALLGTNVPGLGFTVVYAPQPDNIWFPVSFGSEFKIHVLFFFRRQIIIDAQNAAFEKTHTGARILPSPAPSQPE